MEIEKLIESINVNNSSHNKYIKSVGNKVGPGCIYKAPGIKINYKTKYKQGTIQIKDIEVEYKESLFQETMRSKKVLEEPQAILKKSIKGPVAEISPYFKRLYSEKSCFTHYLGIKLDNIEKLQELYETKALEHWVNQADYTEYCQEGTLLKSLFKTVLHNLHDNMLENYKKETKQVCDNKYFKEEIEFINALKHFGFVPQEIECRMDELDQFKSKTGLLLVEWPNVMWAMPKSSIIGLERLIIYKE